MVLMRTVDVITSDTPSSEMDAPDSQVQVYQDFLFKDLSNFGFSRIIAIDGAKAVKKIYRINTEK